MNETHTLQIFGMINRIFASYMGKSLQDKNITYTDSICLVNIKERSGCSQEKLAETLVMDKAAIARSVKKLSQLGYVRWIFSKTDKRQKLLDITDSGLELYVFLQNLNTKWLDLIKKDISETEFAQFISVAEKICCKVCALQFPFIHDSDI